MGILRRYFKYVQTKSSVISLVSYLVVLLIFYLSPIWPSITVFLRLLDTARNLHDFCRGLRSEAPGHCLLLPVLCFDGVQKMIIGLHDFLL